MRVFSCLASEYRAYLCHGGQQYSGPSDGVVQLAVGYVADTEGDSWVVPTTERDLPLNPRQAI